MRPPFCTQWFLDDVEHEVLFRYYPGHPGCWYRPNGDPGDPPEPDEVEIIGVYRPHPQGDREDVDVTDKYADELAESDNFREQAAEIYAESQMPEEA